MFILQRRNSGDEMSQNNNIIKSNDEHMIYIRLKTNFDKAGLYLIGASNKKGPFFIKKRTKEPRYVPFEPSCSQKEEKLI